jgi:4,5-dihydroxyphthalate decarboxylase
MATKITIALDRYDRHFPFFLGQLDVPIDLELVPLEVGMVPPRRDGVDRHRRMLHDHEFDAAEVSLASYIVAKSRGAPFTAIPVFPRRLFSQNHIFVSERSTLCHPKELTGKRVVVWAFQVTMSVLAKGDMKRVYGADWRSMKWLTLRPEEVPVSGLPIERLSPESDPIEMLRKGEADAFIYPHPPEEAMSSRHGIRRLFEQPAAECDRYFRKFGYFPIMHVIVLRQETIDVHPAIPMVLLQLWESAKAIARNYYHDPGFGLPALTRLSLETQDANWGPDIWPSGIMANRANLEIFVEDMVDQQLIDRLIPIEQLFCPSTLAT